MEKTISILGCGWLGLPLAVELKNKGYIVKGSTTSRQKLNILKEKGLQPFYVNVSETASGDNLSSFFQSSIVIITLPFKRSFGDPYLYKRQIDAIVEYLEISAVDFVIFISSTAVYPNQLEDAREDAQFAADNPRSKVLLEIEQSLLKNKNFKSTIIRFGGLYGDARPIGKFLAGKEAIAGGDEPVNLIHLDDCVQIIKEIIQKDIRAEIFNAVSDKHPKRKDLYIKAAKKLNLPPPVFEGTEKIRTKIVCNDKLKQRLHYQFKHPDPLENL